MKIKSALTIACMAMATSVAANATESFEDALQNGKVKGRFGIYFEDIDHDSKTKSESFANAFLRLKYETASWNNFQFGAEAYAASKLADDDNDPGKTRGFFQDFEGMDNSPAALAELYVKYNFTENSYGLVGRFDHKKISRLDDAQSDGGYVHYNEIDGLTVNAGWMRQFAELDYDDFEDFGKSSQDLSTNKDTDDHLLFIDATYAINDNASINPFVYHQGDYATVVGAGLTLNGKLNDSTKIGADFTAYNVSADTTNAGEDSNVMAFLPWLKVGNVKFGVGIVEFSEGMSKPFWFNDELTGFDQKNQYGKSAADDLTATQATIEYKKGKFSVRYGIQEWETDDDSIISETEQELIFGYKFSKKLDLAVRLFDVAVDHAANSDYQKIETRLRMKF